jgi:hypothetical protein
VLLAPTVQFESLIVIGSVCQSMFRRNFFVRTKIFTIDGVGEDTCKPGSSQRYSLAEILVNVSRRVFRNTCWPVAVQHYNWDLEHVQASRSYKTFQDICNFLM